METKQVVVLKLNSLVFMQQKPFGTNEEKKIIYILSQILHYWNTWDVSQKKYLAATAKIIEKSFFYDNHAKSYDCKNKINVDVWSRKIETSMI